MCGWSFLPREVLASSLSLNISLIESISMYNIVVLIAEGWRLDGFLVYSIRFNFLQEILRVCGTLRS